MSGSITSVFADNESPAAQADPNLPKEFIPDVSPHFEDSEGNPLLFRRNRPLPMTGDTTEAMRKCDEEICWFLKSWQVPGCALAIAQHGKLVYARGYGWADIVSSHPVLPNSLFRIASISKSITAVATLKLCQEHLLKQDSKALRILDYPAIPYEHADLRLNKMTIRHLLECSAGWNRDHSGDPMFCPYAPKGAELMSTTLRPTAESAIRYWLRTPLNFEPGTHHVYSNLSYAILGQVISKTTKLPYEQYVRQSILEPMGIRGMRLGKTLVAAPNEVTYYPFPGQEDSRSLFPNYTQEVPLCYGGDFAIEANQSEAGWIASAPELAKFVCTVFGDRGKSPLDSATLNEMLTQPDLPEWTKGKPFFAEGWEIYPNADPQQVVICRHGSLPGTASFMARRGDGTTVALIANSRPHDAEVFEHQLAKLAWRAASCMKKDSQTDLFNKFD